MCYEGSRNKRKLEFSITLQVYISTGIQIVTDQPMINNCETIIDGIKIRYGESGVSEENFVQYSGASDESSLRRGSCVNCQMGYISASYNWNTRKKERGGRKRKSKYSVCTQCFSY